MTEKEIIKLLNVQEGKLGKDLIGEELDEMFEKAKYKNKGLVPMDKIYAKLSRDEKNPNNYEEKLNDELLTKCNSAMPDKVSYRFYGVLNYKLDREIQCRKDNIKTGEILIKSFNCFKKEESNSIDIDYAIQLEEKEIYKEKLKNAISSITKKIKQFTKIIENEIVECESLVDKTESIPFDMKEDAKFAREVNGVLKDRFMEFIN